MPNHIETPEVAAILEAMPSFGSEFAKTFANHAPMVLTALDRIGGSPERMQEFFDHYNGTKSLFEFGTPSEKPLTAENWHAQIGNRAAEPDLRIFFADEVARLGIDDAVRCCIDRLAPGVGASAFHALMRLAYGLMRRNETDVAVALGYWAATFLEMPEPTGAAAITDDPVEMIAKVAQISSFGEIPIGELLWHNMRGHAEHPDFEGIVDWLAIDDGTLDKMAAASLAIFASSQHFAALHAVTGVHWLRIVLPYCTTPEVMLRKFWLCISTLIPDMEYPTLPDAETLTKWRTVDAPPWSKIWAVAVASYDEHDISIAYSAYEEERVIGDPLYRVVAARRMGLIPDYRKLS